jgi:hypothetical protein
MKYIAQFEIDEIFKAVSYSGKSGKVEKKIPFDDDESNFGSIKQSESTTHQTDGMRYYTFNYDKLRGPE